MSDCKIIFTKEAISHIKERMALSDKETPTFHLTLIKYGCNGYGYQPNIIDTPGTDDKRITTNAPFSVAIKKRYAVALDGTVVDYVTTRLGNTQMIFKNPNAEGACGCGESVNLKVQLDDE